MELKIAETIKLSPSTNAIRFNKDKYDFKAGQYAYVDGFPFSISSSPNNPYLEITARISKNVGEISNFSEPSGNYFQKENSNKNIIFIGAGIGIAPLLSILRYIKENSIKINTHFISSSRTQNEILWKEEIESLTPCSFTITREKWDGRVGRINFDMIEKTNFPIHETDFYLCGSPEFIVDMKNLLIKKGVKEINLKHG